MPQPQDPLDVGTTRPAASTAADRPAETPSLGTLPTLAGPARAPAPHASTTLAPDLGPQAALGRFGRFVLEARVAEIAGRPLLRAHDETSGLAALLLPLSAPVADTAAAADQAGTLARLTALTHQNIVKLQSAVRAGPPLPPCFEIAGPGEVLVLDAFDGSLPLADWLEDQPLTRETAGRILADVAAAVDYAVGKSIVLNPAPAGILMHPQRGAKCLPWPPADAPADAAPAFVRLAVYLLAPAETTEQTPAQCLAASELLTPRQKQVLAALMTADGEAASGRACGEILRQLGLHQNARAAAPSRNTRWLAAACIAALALAILAGLAVKRHRGMGSEAKPTTAAASGTDHPALASTPAQAEAERRKVDLLVQRSPAQDKMALAMARSMRLAVLTYFSDWNSYPAALDGRPLAPYREADKLLAQLPTYVKSSEITGDGKTHFRLVLTFHDGIQAEATEETERLLGPDASQVQSTAAKDEMGMALAMGLQAALNMCFDDLGAYPATLDEPQFAPYRKNPLLAQLPTYVKSSEFTAGTGQHYRLLLSLHHGTQIEVTEAARRILGSKAAPAPGASGTAPAPAPGNDDQRAVQQVQRHAATDTMALAMARCLRLALLGYYQDVYAYPASIDDTRFKSYRDSAQLLAQLPSYLKSSELKAGTGDHYRLVLTFNHGTRIEATEKAERVMGPDEK